MTVDGDVFAEPLYVPALMIAGGRRDVVFAATEHDSVYAFDVHGTRDTPLWKAAFIDPQKDVRTLTEQDVLCPFITPEVGITPTPAIDRASEQNSDRDRAGMTVRFAIPTVADGTGVCGDAREGGCVWVAGEVGLRGYGLLGGATSTRTGSERAVA
jgi:hypothetical protein